MEWVEYVGEQAIILVPIIHQYTVWEVSYDPFHAPYRIGAYKTRAAAIEACSKYPEVAFVEDRNGKVIFRNYP